MRYCKNCGVDISTRGNRAAKCKFCQRQDTALLKRQRDITGLGGQNLFHPRAKFSKSPKSFRDMQVYAHRNAVLPEDNSDIKQNAMEIQRRQCGLRTREKVYRGWKY